MTLEYEKENSEFDLIFWPHPRITSRCIPISVCQSKKTALNLEYITKLTVLYQAEQTDYFYTPSSV